MSTTLNFSSDVRGNNAYAPSFSVTNFSITIAASTPESFTVPSDYKQWIAVFSSNAGVDYWVARNATAALPAGATFAATSSCLYPSARLVIAGDVISVISANGGNIGVSLYAIS